MRTIRYDETQAASIIKRIENVVRYSIPTMCLLDLHFGEDADRQMSRKGYVELKFYPHETRSGKPETLPVFRSEVSFEK